MKRAYQSSAIQSKPDLSKLVSEGFPTNGDPVNSVPPTQPGEGWFYLTTEELVSIVEEAKLVPDNVPQVVQALKIIIDNTLKACKYFVTVEGEGVQDVEQAKKFLAVIHGVAPSQSADLAADSTAVPTVKTIHDLAVLKTAAVAYTDKANTFTATQLVQAALTVTLGTGTAFTVNGASALKGAVTVTGNTSITGTLGVTGKATLGEISASGAASFAKTITATGGVKGDLTGDVTGNLNGNATSADTSDKLTTARKITVNVGSTTISTFDGTKDITTGITGTLATSHGGTGRTDGLAISVTQKYDKTSRGDIEYGTNNGYLVTKGAIAYWNGAYNENGTSNLVYCSGGTIVNSGSAQTIEGVKIFNDQIVANGGIKGTLTGSSTSCTGNAATATKLATARKISITGDGAGSTTFDGSADRSITFTLDSTGVTAAAYGPAANATLKHSGTFTVPQVTVDAKGRVTAAATRTYTLPADSNTDTKVTQTVTTTNDEYPVLTTALNDATANRTEGVRFDTKVKINHSTGTVTAPKFNGPSTSCMGNAATATKWSAKRTITLGGDLSGSVSMDGSANVTLNATIKDTGGAVPVGAIIEYMGQGSVPSGYLLCNGANVSRTTYANLFKAIGTKFGTGDGSTTFTLPNGNGRYMQGTTGKPGSAISAGLPNISGWAAWPWMGQNNNGDYSGCFYYSQHGTQANNNGAYSGLTGLGFSANRFNSIYSGSSTVLPSSYSCQYLIKY